MLKRPLIIDCDPGIDDAECLMMVQGSGQFDIRGITAVHGNVLNTFTVQTALLALTQLCLKMQNLLKPTLGILSGKKLLNRTANWRFWQLAHLQTLLLQL